MLVDRLLGHWLYDVPMFYELPVFNPEDVNDGSFKDARFDYPTIVDGDKVIFGYYALYFVDGRGVFLPEFPEEPYQTFLAVVDGRIVLGVSGTQQFIQRFELMPAQKLIHEPQDQLLILFSRHHILSFLRC